MHIYQVEKRKASFQIMVHRCISRKDGIDTIYIIIFYQVEILAIAVHSNLHLGHLKENTEYLLKNMLGLDIQVHFHRSYF